MSWAALMPLQCFIGPSAVSSAPLGGKKPHPTERRATSSCAPRHRFLETQGYAMVRQIGKGSFGRALLVRNKGSKEFVVKEVKLTNLSASEKDLARLEIKVLRSVSHPNIVRYIDHFEDNSHLYIVMEYADSGDLGKVLKGARMPLLESEVLDYFVQICMALEHIHSKQVLHRDLKPSNVFLSNNKKLVKMGDFGISTILQGAHAQVKTQCGTPYYFSPELCQKKAYNSKSDIWSLGCLLYEMLTLRRPFNGANMKLLMGNICVGQYAPLPVHFSKEVQNLVRKMLSHDPSKRPSMSAILAMTFIQDHARGLREHLEQEAALVGPPPIDACKLLSKPKPIERPLGREPIGSNASTVGQGKKQKGASKASNPILTINLHNELVTIKDLGRRQRKTPTSGERGRKPAEVPPICRLVSSGVAYPQVLLPDDLCPVQDLPIIIPIIQVPGHSATSTSDNGMSTAPSTPVQHPPAEPRTNKASPRFNGQLHLPCPVGPRKFAAVKPTTPVRAPLNSMQTRLNQVQLFVEGQQKNNESPVKLKVSRPCPPRQSPLTTRPKRPTLAGSALQKEKENAACFTRNRRESYRTPARPSSPTPTKKTSLRESVAFQGRVSPPAPQVRKISPLRGADLTPSPTAARRLTMDNCKLPHAPTTKKPTTPSNHWRASAQILQPRGRTSLGGRSSPPSKLQFRTSLRDPPTTPARRLTPSHPVGPASIRATPRPPSVKDAGRLAGRDKARTRLAEALVHVRNQTHHIDIKKDDDGDLGDVFISAAPEVGCDSFCRLPTQTDSTSECVEMMYFIPSMLANRVTEAY